MKELHEYPQLIADKSTKIELILFRISRLKQQLAIREWQLETQIIDNPLYKNEGMRKHGKAGLMLDDEEVIGLMVEINSDSHAAALAKIDHQKLRDEFAVAKLLHQSTHAS